MGSEVFLWLVLNNGIKWFNKMLLFYLINHFLTISLVTVFALWSVKWFSAVFSLALAGFTFQDHYKVHCPLLLMKQKKTISVKLNNVLLNVDIQLTLFQVLCWCAWDHRFLHWSAPYLNWLNLDVENRWWSPKFHCIVCVPLTEISMIILYEHFP